MAKSKNNIQEQVKLNAPAHKGEIIDDCDPSWTLEEQSQDAVKEGFKLLEIKDNTKPIKNPVIKDNINIPTGDDEKNPFIKAKNIILNKWKGNINTLWKYNEIVNMEKSGNVNNRFYDDFIHEVRLLGETF